MSFRLKALAACVGLLILSLVLLLVVNIAYPDSASGRDSGFVHLAGMSDGLIIDLPEEQAGASYWFVDAEIVDPLTVASKEMVCKYYDDVLPQAVFGEIGSLFDPAPAGLGRNIFPVGLRQIRSPTSHLI